MRSIILSQELFITLWDLMLDAAHDIVPYAVFETAMPASCEPQSPMLFDQIDETACQLPFFRTHGF